MAFHVDDLVIGGQMKDGSGICPATGEGPTKINGSTMIEGPVVMGNPTTFPFAYGAVNIGPLTNSDATGCFVPGGMCYGINNPYSLAVSGPSAMMGNVDVAGNLTAMINVQAQGNVISNCGRHILALKKDLPFDMPHPNREGWRLRHVCIEGPEIAVYCRGKVPPDGIIHLPTFWDGLVNPEDMSISLTPIGCWQELFVKEIRWGKQVVVSNNAGGPINADYYIVARRLDDDLVVEYEGESHEDYPGGNEGYSFNFEHNYVEGLIRDMVSETVNNIGEKE
jgi:hypothetical protein|tara:strand:+ start:238 stop:1077 length:840 start_codon:yes stop_codon:yes gene_type:complete